MRETTDRGGEAVEVGVGVGVGVEVEREERADEAGDGGSRSDAYVDTWTEVAASHSCWRALGESLGNPRPVCMDTQRDNNNKRSIHQNNNNVKWGVARRNATCRFM